MSNFIVREAREEDMVSVIELENKCFRYPYPPHVLYMLRALYPELFLVAIDSNSGRIVGYVSAVIRRSGYGHIVSICVDPDYRRRGVGRALMLEVERRLREIFSVCNVRLEVRISNYPAINLYRSLGYRAVEVIEDYYPDGETALVMIKNICRDSSSR